FVVRAVVTNSIQASARNRLVTADGSAVRPWLAVYQTRTIVGAALLEGGAFFLLVAYMAEGAPWVLVVAAVLWIAMAWLHFPTRDKVEAWVTDQQAAAQ